MNAKENSPVVNKLLITALGLFVISLLVAGYNHFIKNRWKHAILLNPAIHILATIHDQDRMVSGVLIKLHPKQQKCGLVFVNSAIITDEIPLEKQGSDAAGSLKQTITEIINRKIHHTIALDLKDLEKVIDLAGGIPVYNDPETIIEHPEFNFKTGGDFFSGRQTAAYISQLSSNEPIELVKRISRQESIFLSLYDIVKSRNIPDSILNLIYTILNTDLSTEEFLSLYHFVKDNDIVISLTELPGEPVFDYKDQRHYLKMNLETVVTAFNQFEAELKSDQFLDGEKARIEILNFTGINGLAKQNKSILHSKRIKVLTTSNGWNDSLEKSLVLDRSGNSEYSYKAAAVLGISEVRHVIRRDLGLDTSILLGDDIGEKHQK